ncbi:hypothetical protein Droror1_Dr00014268 [Drosera rotundifolia]
MAAVNGGNQYNTPSTSPAVDSKDFALSEDPRHPIGRQKGAELMSKYGISVPKGVAVCSLDEVKNAVKNVFPNQSEADVLGKSTYQERETRTAVIWSLLPAVSVDPWAKDRMRKLERPYLFSFAGAPRPGNPKSIRGQIIDQCKKTSVCKLLECDFGKSKCHSPSSIMKMFQSSLFCLQPQGDSYTRRSAFDSMLAGCIPVFFHPGSAYTQYTWHLPKNFTTYSVFTPENDIRKRNLSFEDRLRQIPSEQDERQFHRGKQLEIQAA